MASGLLRTISGSGSISGGNIGSAISGSTLGDPSGRVWAEDVYDTFTDLTPWEHPVVASLPQGSTDSVQVNWVGKKLSAFSRTALDAKQEGYTFPFIDNPAGTADTNYGDASFEARWIGNNYIENFTLPLSVSSRARAVDMFGGGGDEFMTQAAAKVKEMGRNIEVRMFDDTFAVEANTGFIGDIGSNPTQMKPLMELIFQNRLDIDGNSVAATQQKIPAFRSSDMSRVDRINTNTGTLTNKDLPIDAVAYPVWAQTRLTETMLTKAQEYMRGSKYSTVSVRPDTVVVPPATFGHVGAFGVGPGTGSGYGDLTANISATDERISRVCRWFRSQFGLVQIIESQWLDQASNTGAATSMDFGAGPRTTDRNVGLVWLFERKFLELTWFQRPTLEKLAKIGLQDNGLVWSEVTLKLLHPRAAGVIIGVNNV